MIGENRVSDGAVPALYCHHTNTVLTGNMWRCGGGGREKKKSVQDKVIVNYKHDRLRKSTSYVLHQ